MYSNRRLSPYYAPDLRSKPVKKSTLPVKICLISAAVLMFAMLGFLMYTGSAVLYVHFWVYIAAFCLLIMLLLGAGAFAVYNKCNTDRARRIAMILLIALMLLLGSVGVAFCQVAAMQKPLGFFDSPAGENRIVIMTTTADKGVVVTAYPAIGDHFYVAALESEIIQSNGVISGVEWEGERLAKVRLEDIDGNDTELVVDFAMLYGGEEAAG